MGSGCFVFPLITMTRITPGSFGVKVFFQEILISYIQKSRLQNVPIFNERPSLQ